MLHIQAVCYIYRLYVNTAISIKVVHEQSGKVEYERERLLGIAKKFMNLLAIPSILSRSYSTFPLCSGTTLIEIAVYMLYVTYTSCMLHIRAVFYTHGPYFT